MTRPVRACISASALAHNVAVARARMPGAKLMAAVKANAYGHGLAVCAPELARAGVEGFAVASMEEAEQLYDLALGPPACLLAGPFAPEEIPLAAARGHILVIHRAAQLAWLQEQRWDGPLSIWIKVDSGMHRLGFAPRALGPVFEALSAVHSPLRILGLMSHLARSDTPDDPHNVRQIREFRAAIGQWGERTLGEHSLANSGAILALAEARFPWMRPGLMLYGLSPFPGQTGRDLGLRPVLSWQAQIIATRRLAPGEWLGYGAAYQAPHEQRVGVVACGYGDGFDRHLGQGAPVWIGSQRSQTLGRVSMDLLFVDLQDSDAQEGDWVTLMGVGAEPLESLAERLGTIPYELGTRIQARVPRVLVP